MNVSEDHLLEIADRLDAVSKVVFINGPPRCGKDTFVTIARETIATDAAMRDTVAVNQIRVGFADELKERTHLLHRLFVRKNDKGQLELCDISESTMVAPFDFFEKSKDLKLAEFMGVSPRQAYIDTAERLLRPVFGQHIFSRMWLDAVRRKSDLLKSANGRQSIVYVPDLGFQHEADLFAKILPSEKIAFVQIHRASCDFSKDSRRYVDMTKFGIETAIVANNGDLESFQEKSRTLMRELFHGIAKSHETGSKQPARMTMR
ncbi:MAG: hypothetical protein ING19_14020 [Azospirillum sp.]|nr:hypothetical protein [Azospirillum sp.]